MTKSYQYKGFTIVEGYSSYFIFRSSITDENDYVGKRESSIEAENFIDGLLKNK